MQPWVWSVYSSLIFIAAFLFLLWQGGNQRLWVSSKIFIITVVFFFALTLAQDLAVADVYFISSKPFAAMNTLVTSNNLLNNSLSWHALSYSALISFSWWTFLISASMFFFILRHFCESRRRLKLLVGHHGRVSNRRGEYTALFRR